MKKHILYILTAFLLVTASCTSSNGKKTKFSYPSDINTLCDNARNDAISCIQGKGTPVQAKKSIVLEKRPNCIKKYGHWAWQEPSAGNIWVVGATWKKGDYFYIQVGCNPKTLGEVNYGTLKHEHGHYVLWSNFNDPSHNQKYGSCFEGWKGVKVHTMSITLDDEEVIIDYLEEPKS